MLHYLIILRKYESFCVSISPNPKTENSEKTRTDQRQPIFAKFGAHFLDNYEDLYSERGGRKFFLQIPAKMWRFSGRIFILLSYPVIFIFQILLLFFFSLLLVPILFENNHQSSCWSTCLIPVFCNGAKSLMTTSLKKGGVVRLMRPRLNPPPPVFRCSTRSESH